MYLLKDNDTIIYPYSIQKLKRDNPNVSFPAKITDKMLESFNVYKVHTVNKPDVDYTKDVREDTPMMVGSMYFQTWIIEDADSYTINKRVEIKWNEVREKRNELLKESDWTQFNDSPITGSKLEEWKTYRMELRDITNQDDPFNIVWPTSPK